MNPELTHYSPAENGIFYAGRIDFEDPAKPKLSSAGACFIFRMSGEKCILELENQHEEPHHNYMAITIDGVYQGRIRVEKGITRYTIAGHLSEGEHTLLVCKATESFIGYVQLNAIECQDLLPLTDIPQRKIELIGNSITSGAQTGEPGLPCDSGEWHDHNNAFLAYGPQLALQLNAQWVLSSISGMGLTRNWNTEGPGVPAFYDNLYLDQNADKPWTKEQYSPDLLTICLGTNDISEGDGSYNRQPLDSAIFISKYLEFLHHLRTKYPDARICLLNSPTFGAEDKARFDACLKVITEKANADLAEPAVFSFSWSKQYAGGCTFHPGIQDHQEMVAELLPFVKQMMNW